jgi:hypothetical protein
MALGSTQPLTEISTRNLPGGGDIARPARKAYNLTAICETSVKKVWEPRRLASLWVSTARYRVSFTFIFAFLSTGIIVIRVKFVSEWNERFAA